MFHTWPKNYVKYDGHDVEPVQIFLLGSSRGQTNLIWWMYKTTSKLLLYHCKDTEKARVLLLGPTGITAIYIGGTNSHSRLGIKPGTKLLGLNDKFKPALKKSYSEVIIDELFLVSSDLRTNIDSRFEEIFMMIPEEAFAGPSVM